MLILPLRKQNVVADEDIIPFGAAAQKGRRGEEEKSEEKEKEKGTYIKGKEKEERK